MTANTAEAAGSFCTSFTTKSTKIHDDIRSLDPSNEPDFLRLLRTINALEHDLMDASIFLPPYDQRQYALTIKILNESLQSKRPKVKFSFKVKPLPSSNSDTLTTSIASCNESSLRSNLKSPNVFDLSVLPKSTTINICNKNHELITLDDDSDEGKDIYIVSLTNCIIRAGSISNFSTLHIENVSNCILSDLSISNSVLIHKMSNSIITLKKCHQFRMHEANNIMVFLDVPTNPIIEDSSGIKFGPYDPHPDPEVVNQYNQVSDFNWLKQQQSPHWSLISLDQVKITKSKLQNLKLLSLPDILNLI